MVLGTRPGSKSRIYPRSLPGGSPPGLGKTLGKSSPEGDLPSKGYFLRPYPRGSAGGRDSAIPLKLGRDVLRREINSRYTSDTFLHLFSSSQGWDSSEFLGHWVPGAIPVTQLPGLTGLTADQRLEALGSLVVLSITAALKKPAKKTVETYEEESSRWDYPGTGYIQ